MGDSWLLRSGASAFAQSDGFEFAASSGVGPQESASPVCGSSMGRTFEEINSPVESGSGAAESLTSRNPYRVPVVASGHGVTGNLGEPAQKTQRILDVADETRPSVGSNPSRAWASSSPHGYYEEDPDAKKRRRLLPYWTESKIFRVVIPSCLAIAVVVFLVLNLLSSASPSGANSGKLTLVPRHPMPQPTSFTPPALLTPELVHSSHASSGTIQNSDVDRDEVDKIIEDVRWSQSLRDSGLGRPANPQAADTYEADEQASAVISPLPQAEEEHEIPNQEGLAADPPVKADSTKSSRPLEYKDYGKQPFTTRQKSVVDAMRWAWKGYKSFAWGQDMLNPISKKGEKWFNLGLTLIDALDTMYLMGMEQEFQEAREWVAGTMDLNQNVDVNLFETTIRVLGAFLTSYTLTNDQVFLGKAVDLADRLMVAFNTKSGVPLSDVNLARRTASRPRWSKYSSTAEVATVQLEFNYLAALTGDSKYSKAVRKVMDVIDANKPKSNLVPMWIDPESGIVNGIMSNVSWCASYFYSPTSRMFRCLFQFLQEDLVSPRSHWVHVATATMNTS